VVDAIRRARLAQHPSAQMRLTAQVRADELQGDDALDEDVPGAINDAHTSFTKPGFKAITSCDDLADHRIDARGLLPRRSLCTALLLHICLIFS
jgi:hypothetical protein